MATDGTFEDELLCQLSESGPAYRVDPLIELNRLILM